MLERLETITVKHESVDACQVGERAVSDEPVRCRVAVTAVFTVSIRAVSVQRPRRQ